MLAPMDPIAPNGWGWVQTVFATVMGLFALVFGGAFAHLSQRLDGEAAERHRLSDGMRDRGDDEATKLWKAHAELRMEMSQRFDTIQKDLRDFAEKASTSREMLLSSAVTKDDLKQSMDHLVSLLDAKIAPLLIEAQAGRRRRGEAD